MYATRARLNDFIVASVLQLFEFDDSEIECECIQSKPGSHFAFMYLDWDFKSLVKQSVDPFLLLA
jgi:hypothetical protein